MTYISPTHRMPNAQDDGGDATCSEIARMAISHPRCVIIAARSRWQSPPRLKSSSSPFFCLPDSALLFPPPCARPLLHSSALRRPPLSVFAPNMALRPASQEAYQIASLSSFTLRASFIRSSRERAPASLIVLCCSRNSFSRYSTHWSFSCSEMARTSPFTWRLRQKGTPHRTRRMIRELTWWPPFFPPPLLILPPHKATLRPPPSQPASTISQKAQALRYVE